jgi:hypothetical protein
VRLDAAGDPDAILGADAHLRLLRRADGDPHGRVEPDSHAVTGADPGTQPDHLAAPVARCRGLALPHGP